MGSSTMHGPSNRPPYHTTPLDAVTSVIVRRSEIVAAIAGRSLVPPPTGPSSDPQPNLPVPPPAPDPLHYTVLTASSNHDIHVFAMEQDVVEDEIEVEVEVDQAGCTAFANAKCRGQSGHDYMLLVNGNSHWQTIKGDGLKGLLIDATYDPLCNHIATFTEFFKEYRAASLEERADLFITFTHYLITTSWPKMLSRMSTPSSRAYLYDLSKLAPSLIENAWADFNLERAQGRDSKLIQYIATVDTDAFDLFTESYQFPGDSSLPKLRALCADLYNRKERVCVYDKDTCTEFHHLLVGVMNGYWIALDRLKAGTMPFQREQQTIFKLKKKKSGWDLGAKAEHVQSVQLGSLEEMMAEASKGGLDGTRLRDCIESLSRQELDHWITTSEQKLKEWYKPLEKIASRVWILSQALWILAYSQSLRFHLASLAQATLLAVPNVGHMWTSDDIRTGAVQRDGHPTGVRSRAPKAPMLEESSDIEDDIDIETELGQVEPNMGQGVDRSELWLQWIRLHSSHLASLHVLKKFCTRHNTGFEVSLLATPRAKYSPKIGKWRPAVSSLFSDVEYANSVCDTLRRKILANIDLPRAGNDRPLANIFKTFQQTLAEDTELVFSGTVHCEAALATAAAAANLDAGQFIDFDIAANLDSMSVSRLCCPICWDLLEMLRKYLREAAIAGDDCLQVRGRHSTVWPTELPPWTPLPIMKTMVERYRGLVRDALEKMMRAAVAPSLHTPDPSSSVSDSGLASNSSWSSDDDDIGKAISWTRTTLKIDH